MDINKIWKLKPVPQSDFQELNSRIMKFRSGKLKRTLFANITLGLTIVFILLIGYWVNPQRISTWLGILFTVGAILMILGVTNRIVPLYKSLDRDTSNHDFLTKLLEIKRKESFISKQMMNLYFVLLSTGISLYMFEYVKRMTITWGIATYGITFLWFGFNWFVLRPKQISREQRKINAIIDRLKDVNDQLN